MLHTMFAGFLIALGVLEAYLGYTISLTGRPSTNKNASTDDLSEEDKPVVNTKFLKFQRVYFIIMGIYTVILGAMALFNKDAIPNFVLIILVILPIVTDKFIGIAVNKRFYK